MATKAELLKIVEKEIPREDLQELIENYHLLKMHKQAMKEKSNAKFFGELKKKYQKK